LKTAPIPPALLVNDNDPAIAYAVVDAFRVFR
jgi:hypothetical protein